MTHDQTPTIDLCVVTDEQFIELTALFNTHLDTARQDVELSEQKQEPLSFLARKCYAAFASAAEILRNEKMVPFISGNDPHDLSKGVESSPLSNAIGAVTGFTNATKHPTIPEYSVSAKSAMKHMEAIANGLRQLSIIS